jgi:hypothetical protein
VKTIPRVGARLSTRSGQKMACSMTPKRVSTVAATRLIVSQALSGTTHPDFRYQPIAKPEELGDGGRVKWVAGRPGEAPAYAGTDFIIARDGRIAALYLFFDEVS